MIPQLIPPEAWAWLAVLAAALPAAGFAGLALPALLGAPPPERVVARIGLIAAALSLAVSAAVALAALSRPVRAVHVALVPWFSVAGEYGMSAAVLVDLPAAAMMLLTGIATLATLRFADTYLHREPGFLRFFLLVLLFEAGMLVVAMAGTLDALFFGWELVGLCSALLIAFFYERDAPARGGLRAFLTYRACDLGILIAALLLHHTAFASFQPWPAASADVPPGLATAAALLLLVGAMGKSAQFPLSGWLPRAMEGPTPSSALFYGGLSLHAGAWLLLRCAPLFEAAPVARAAVVAVGLVTAVFATLCARVAPDAKGGLAWAALAQVGLIFAEIGLGLYELALAHLVGHVGLRLHQFLRAPSALQDARHRSDALSGDRGLRRPAPSAAVYGLALQRFHIDALLHALLVRPVLALARALARQEERLERWVQPPPPEKRP